MPRKNVVYFPAVTPAYPETPAHNNWDTAPTRSKPVVDYVTPGVVPAAEEANYVWWAASQTDQNLTTLAGAMSANNWQIPGFCNNLFGVAWDKANGAWLLQTVTGGVISWSTLIEGGTATGSAGTSPPTTARNFAINRAGVVVATVPDSLTTPLAGTVYARYVNIWAAQTSAPAGIAKTVYWCDYLGLFVCVALKIFGAVTWTTTSPDGITWTDRSATAPIANQTSILRGWFSDSGSRLIYMLPDAGFTHFYSSTDAIHWDAVVSPLTSTEVVAGLQHDSEGGYFVLLATDSVTGNGRLLLSQDNGFTWFSPVVDGTLPAIMGSQRGCFFSGLAVFGSVYAITTTANASVSGFMYYSTDQGQTWTQSLGFYMLSLANSYVRILANDNQLFGWLELPTGSGGANGVYIAGFIDGQTPYVNF